MQFFLPRNGALGIIMENYGNSHKYIPLDRVGQVVGRLNVAGR